MSSDVAIRVENLSKRYQLYDKPQHRLLQGLLRGRKQFFREFWALKDVSFEVKKGETVGIIGRNGAGKSTLLQLICGTLTPTSGELEVNGRVAALLELGAGFNPEFTGRENIYMNAALLGLSKQDIDRKYEEIVAFADIGQFIEQPVKMYSSGMYVRLAFAVIAHVDADILVIDEALAVGDAFFKQKCMRFLRKFMETGTVLFVSHDTGAVVNLCSEALFLEAGSVKMRGTAKEVTEAYLEALYEEQQGRTTASLSKDLSKVHESEPLKDQRLDFINATQFRNDIQLFEFNAESSSFGKGGARVLDVSLLDEQGNRLSWIVGGEIVSLEVVAEFRESASNPIVGFYIKDRLGQTLFGDNTFLSYADRGISVGAGEMLSASFEFRMPILPVGDYSVCVAVADGTQHENIQHHWLHDALLFRSHSSSVCTGLVGVPMKNIKMKCIGGIPRAAHV